MPFVLCSVPALAMVRAPPWTYHGFDQFPALFFGANSSGLESGAQMAEVSRYQLAAPKPSRHVGQRVGRQRLVGENQEASMRDLVRESVDERFSWS